MPRTYCQLHDLFGPDTSRNWQYPSDLQVPWRGGPEGFTRALPRLGLLLPWERFPGYHRVAHAEAAAAARGVSLSVSVVDDVPLALAPRGAVDRVVDELLGNALAYARSRISVRVARDGDFVRIDVEDDGPGIPEAERARIFDRFARGAQAVPGGSGLGLALVRESALAAGGDAWIESGEDGGLRVCTRWPAVTRDAGRGPTPR